MKAVRINEYGDPSVVVIDEVAMPAPSEGQVLVEVCASSLNPFDTAVRSGYMKEAIPLQLPVTLGGDIAGIVAKVGQGVTEYAIGDKVYGQASVVAGNSGAFAEFAATKSSQVAKAPSNLDFYEASSLPLVGVSALQALTEHVHLQPGQKILIQGGSGGIGSIAIQIAKHLGAYVAATAPTESVEMVKKLGADEIIDYKTQDFTEIVHNYDAVFDTVGGDIFQKSLGSLRQGGMAVSMIAHVDEAIAKKHSVTAITQKTSVTTEQLNKLTELIEKGVVTAHIAELFPLQQIQQAFEAREGGAQGKIVLKIK